MTQTNMISFKQTHANETNSYNKPSTIRIEQMFRFRCSNTLEFQIEEEGGIKREAGKFRPKETGRLGYTGGWQKHSN